MQSEICGTGVALITPFKENFEIDFDALEKVVKHVTKGGVDYLVVLGTTGENVTLSSDEKAKVFNAIREINAKKLPIVLGHGGNNTAALIENISRYDLSEVHSILSVVPSYNKPNQRGIYEHYKAFAQVCPKPILLYNVPGRTGVNMEPETTLQLAKDFKNIIGVKEASGKMEQIMTILRSAPKDFLVISGDDSITVPLISVGCHGLISVIANAFPNQISSAVRSALNGDYQYAKEQHYKLFDLMNLGFADGNPGGVKCMMSKIGLIKNILRLPLYPVNEKVEKQIEIAVGKI